VLDDAKPEREDDVAVERAVRCNRCDHALTSTKEAIDVDGQHAHVFVNPSGVVFHIRMFKQVPGAVVAGEPDSRTSWFANTASLFALCAGCGGHVGWRYVNLDDGAIFFALIEDSIVGP
jgi:hypothetical protein